jgi:hypothetical protein
MTFKNMFILEKDYNTTRILQEFLQQLSNESQLSYVLMK